MKRSDLALHLNSIREKANIMVSAEAGNVSSISLDMEHFANVTSISIN